MSGDVQPRKRKDKRRKKDEFGVEEPRGTAAVFGEGDVLMHSHHEHGTGGHWCAKIIFFSLLAVLVTLIGLIILENRGLSELEANAVESRYSGVLEGWIEDSHDDDHHDEHTLELKHHNYEDIHEDNDVELEDEDEENHSDDDEETHSDEDEDDGEEAADEEADDQGKEYNEDSEEEAEEDFDDQRLVNDEIEEQRTENDNDDNDDDENDDDNNDDDNDDADDDDDIDDDNDDHDNDDDNCDDNIEDNDDEIEYVGDEDDEDSEQDEKEVDDQDEEIEKIEREVSDEEEQAAPYEVVDTEKDKDGEDTFEEDEEEEDEFESPLEVDDVIVPPVVEHITVPSGKPFVELDEEPSSEKPIDSLAEEEEYERRQEELRQQKEESSSQMWLKLVVGGALLVATHAVIRRSTAPRDSSDVEDNTTPEDTPPLVDRRMTLIPKEAAPLITPETFEPVHEEAIKKIAPQTKTVYTTPIRKQESDEKEESDNSFEAEVVPEKAANDRDKELYSDEEEIDEEVNDEEVEEEVKESPAVEDKLEASKDEESEPEEVPDDVEIIDEEQLEEEIEEEEEEISDVDDAELLTRLEAKYGRLPEPHRPGQKPKDGGNNAEDTWPGDPADQYWRQQLDQAEEEIRQGAWSAANWRLAAAELANSGRARWLAARLLDAQAEAKRDNALLTRAITAYLHLLKMYDGLSDAKLKMIASRALDRIQFRGNYLSAEPVYRLLIHRFPDEVSYRNNLTVSFLMANRADLASDTLKETLKLWPEDRVALAHYGFLLKTTYNKVEESVTLFNKALEGDKGPACEPRFYYHLGDALLLLNRFEEAHEVHKRGAKYGHFLSPSQRSLYNVERLKGRPWWRIEDTPYVKLARALEQSWMVILKEGEAAKALYEMEKEGLKKKGEWSQLDIFVRGREIPGRCKRAPVTCSIVKAEVAAAGCRRGQIKFSSMEPGTHVRPHVGPTNCRLRMHLALSNTKDTYIRVDQETRQWQTGKTLLFDDSFEHEVWHNGTGTRLVLIVDVWHPELSAAERRQLPAI